MNDVFSFHDAELISLSIDSSANSLRAEFLRVDNAVWAIIASDVIAFRLENLWLQNVVSRIWGGNVASVVRR